VSSFYLLPGNFGNILIADGNSNNVTLLNVEKKTNCQLTKFPNVVADSAGGLITSDDIPQPLICGGKDKDGVTSDECYLLESGKWSKIHKLPEKMTNLNGVPIDSQWIMFTGGILRNTTGSPISILFNKKGQNIKLEPMTKLREYHCSAILSSNESSTKVGLLGGWHGLEKSMERYNCVKGDIPTCEKLSDGPDMINGNYYFGCGSLQTSQGGRVLLTIGNEHSPTEVLDLTNEESKWEILSADMDVPHQEKEVGSAYSFVTSTTEPTVGYFLPREERQYIYRVKCEDAQTCSFEKIDTGYENPFYLSVAMAIPADALTCP